MSRREHQSFPVPRLTLVWLIAIVCLGPLGSSERVYTQDARDGVRKGHWAWTPTLPSANDGEVHVLPVRGNVYMLVGAGANITVHAGDEGVLLVDTGLESMSEKVWSAIRTISRRPLRYIVNTTEQADHAGANATLAAKGEIVPWRPAGQSNLQSVLTADRASVISYLTVFHRMAAPTGQVAPMPEAAWPDNTYSTSQKKLSFNDEPVLILHQPSNTDGNSMVHFRTADVVSTGDLVDLTGYPLIDLKAGGSIRALVEGLNRLIEITVPAKKSEGGTLVIPGHGRVADQPDIVYYRDMLAIIRDRVQDMIDGRMTLEQVKAARPTRDYDGRYGKDSGAWTTDMFVEAVYESLRKRL